MCSQQVFYQDKKVDTGICTHGPVVSIFLGDELTEVLKAIENDEFFVGHSAVQMDIGAKVLPHFVKDNTDRNRTSPFAFTGTNSNSVC